MSALSLLNVHRHGQAKPKGSVLPDGVLDLRELVV